jgi:fructokinase
VKLDEKSNPEYHIVPDAAYDFLDISYELMELTGSVDCFYFGTLVQRGEKARRTLRRLLEIASKPLKFLDINLRKDCYTLETIADSLDKADILKMNLQEAHYLAELFEISISSLPDFCVEIMEQRSLKCCLVTMGEHGAFAAAVGGTRAYVPGYEVRVVDTCGSGDAFSAGFVHEYLRGKPLVDCCLLGNALGAMVTQQQGATTPVSTVDIQHFMEAKHPMFYEPTLKQFSAG